MTSQPVEVILVRQLASYLAIPVWIMGESGNLVFYNEAAGRLVGRAFEHQGPISAGELGELFVTTNEDGSPLPTEELPVWIALTEQRTVHRRLRFEPLAGHPHLVDTTAFPLTGQGDRHLGAVALFWEAHD